jgi:glycosyltransferase involved in cell wall biosynthesis
MVLPTRAECAAEVFSEAFAYGVPAIAPDVGGVSTLVSERSGVLLPPDAGANDYASAIVALSERRKDYTALALSAFDEYRQRLNWDVATQTIVSRLREVRDASLRAAA